VVIPQSALPLLELKPRRGSFVFPRLTTAVAISGIAGVGLAVALIVLQLEIWPALVLCAAGCGFGLVSSLVAYHKTIYQIHKSRVICHRGGLASDQTMEFEIRNITYVKLRLPWLRYKLFGVGDVIVQTAGSSTPLVMQAIREPEKIYGILWERMRENGFDLLQQELLHEEKPALIGILRESLGVIIGFLLLGQSVVPMALKAIEHQGKNSMEFVPMALGAVVCALGVLIVMRYLDFRRRTYRVYNDVVVYDEGFLTRRNAFIPYENLADSNTESSVLERILGLCEVRVSCQGSGSEIKFRHIRRGDELSAAIDHLVILARHKQELLTESTDTRTCSHSPQRELRVETPALPMDQFSVGDFRMDWARTLVPLLVVLPILPLWVILMIQSLVRVAVTRYSVRVGSLRHSYRFLSVQEREFTYDKITGLVITQNLWDRLFGTLSLKFWSIGSGQPLEFRNVHRKDIDLPVLMRQVGIPEVSSQPYEAVASFAFSNWLRAHLGFLPVLLILVVGIVIAAIQIDERIYNLLLVPAVGCVIAFITGRLYYSHQRLRFHKYHVEAEQGIVTRRSYYARYTNVKKRKTTCYPAGEDGDLEIFVAGEEAAEQTPAQRRRLQEAGLKSCSFTMRFLPAVQETGQLLDDILGGRIEATSQAIVAAPPELLMEARRSPGNAIFKLIGVSIVVFPLMALLPVTIPFTFIRIGRWRYRLERDRIVKRHGMIFKSETCILMDRVDSLQQSQGPLNKLLGNGSVSIMTAGSSKADLNLVDSAAYREMYALILKNSR
jgi:uncharacterized membrane protein YdbT with pleckstrin-like domain